MNNIIFSLGGRRFLLAVGCGIATSILCWYGKINDVAYSAVVIATVGAYITGNVMQKANEAVSKNEPIQPD